ncbi:hypothetical protein BRC68_06480, partial [Halobacteriales archaeon QH_6_64_20]
MDGSCAADPDPEPSPSKPVFDLPGDPVEVEVAITEFLLDANHSVNRPIVERDPSVSATRSLASCGSVSSVRSTSTRFFELAKNSIRS